MLKIKVLNTLFDKKVPTNAGGWRTTIRGAAEKHKQEEDQRQKEQEDAEKKERHMKEFVESLLPKFRSKDWRKEKIQEGHAFTAEEKKHAVKEITSTINTFAEGNIKKTKLKDLADFVNRHTSRKILAYWNSVEGRFKNSSHFKTIMTPDPNGLMHPVKHNALYLSSIVTLLCSSRVKVGHQEIAAIFRHYGASDEDIELARQIAAFNAVIQVSIETKSSLTDSYKAEVSELMKNETKLLSMNELMDVVFSVDPLKHQEELTFVKTNRQAEANKIVDEKRRKDELKDQAEKRRRKLVEDFEKILESMQLYKGVMTQNRLDAFLYLTKHCQKVIDEHHEDQSSRVPIDVVTYIGIDAFPPLIRQAIVARMHKTNRRPAKMLDPVQVNKAVQAVAAVKKADQAREKEEDNLSQDLDRGSLAGESISTGTGSIMSPSRMLKEMEDQPPDDEEEIEESAESKVMQLLLSDQSSDVGMTTAVKLFGPPKCMQCLREMVALGKTFPGFSYRDAVEVMQYIAATKLAAFLRCQFKRWRYFAARRKWTAKFLAIKRTYYGVWSEFTSYFITLRRCCLRKIVAWRYYTKRAQERRELFRICFWPFYVWRKYSSKEATAKEKTRFLVGRVMPTVLLMKVFRAWKTDSMFEARCTKLSTQNYDKILQKRQRRCFHQLFFYAHQRRFLRRAWFRRGQTMLRTNRRSRLRLVFYLWRVFVHFRRYIRGRARTEVHAFRLRLLGRYKKPWKLLSFADKRMRASAKRRATIETLRREAMKKMKTRKSVVVGAVARRISLADDVSVSSHGSDNSSIGMNSIVEKLEESNGPKDRDPLNKLNHLAQEKPYPIALVKNETKVKRRGKFDWKQEQRSYWDMDSDGDDDVDLPPLLATTYNEMLLGIKASRRGSQVRGSVATPAPAPAPTLAPIGEDKPPQPAGPVPAPIALPEAKPGTASNNSAASTAPSSPSSISALAAHAQLLHNLPPLPKDVAGECMVKRMSEGFLYHPDYLEERLTSITRGYQLRDIWNLFENAFRFHHYAHTAFTNLRLYAKVKKRVRAYQRQQKFMLVSFYFQEWKIFLKNNLELVEHHRGGEGKGDDPRSKKASVHLYHNLRSHLLQKTLKLRKLNEEIRKYYKNFYREAGVDSDEEYDEEKRARRRVRQLNQLDMGERDSDDEEASQDNADKFKSYRLRKANREAERNRPLTPVKYKEKPNPLASLDFDAILSPGAKGSGGGGGGQAARDGDDNISVGSGGHFHRGEPRDKAAAGAVVLAGTGAGMGVGVGKEEGAAAGGAGEVRFQNLFEWDNYNRELETKYTEEMVRYSHRVKAMVRSAIDKAAAEHTSIVAMREQYEQLVEEVLLYEAQNTTKAVGRQNEYAALFKMHAANFLLLKLAKVYYEVQYNIMKEETKKYFRLLRLPMATKRSLHLFRRKRLQNYIRLCKRLQYISAHAPFYYQARVKYVTLMRWTRYLAKAKLDPTPGLVASIKRRLAMHPDFHLALIKRGFETELAKDPRNLYENEELQSSLSDFHMIFKRWKMFTQEEVLFRLMEQKAARLHHFKLLLKTFVALKNTSVNASNYLAYMAENYNQRNSTCFPITRLTADLEQLGKRFIPLRKKQLPTRIKKSNLKISHIMKEQGKNSLTYKKFLTDFQNSVMARINTEQRLLFEAFEGRGKQEFVDAQFPASRDDPIVPPLMSKIEGKTFRDPHLPSNAAHLLPPTPAMGTRDEGRGVLKESNIPGGFRLHKLKFAMIIHNAGASGNNNAPSASAPSSILLGWQFVWAAEGMREIESTPRGSWNAAGVSVQEITVPKDDFVVGVEYLYDGPTIVSLRLKLLQNGWTKWIGGKASLSTLSTYLDAAMSPPEDFESDRKLHDDELRTPALPWRYVIGFSGVMYNGRPTCLGLMVRKIKYQHIFSYTWVFDVILQRRFLAKNSEQPARAVAKGVQAPVSLGDAVGSIPSEVKVLDGGGNLRAANNHPDMVEESLTLSNFDSAAQPGEAGMDGGDSQLEEGSSVGSVQLVPAEELLKKNGQDGLPGADGDSQADDRSAAEDSQADTMSRTDSLADGSESHDDRSHDGGDSPDGHGGGGRSGAERAKKSAMRRFQAWSKHTAEEPLSVSETQFFDLLRMRLTELTVAKQRCEEFSRKLWTSKDLRTHPEAGKLVSLPIIAALTRWLFNALSRKLGKTCATEARGLKLLKQAKKYLAAVKAVGKRKTRTVQELRTLELTPQPWQNKALLGPLERQQKKDYQARLAELRGLVVAQDGEMAESLRKAAETERKGRLLLPRISLSLPVYNNFKMKLSAARHKQNLLENMTLDEIKNGLFGSNMKETLLNKDQMEAIHASLRDRKIELRDTTSLQRLVDGILAEEQERFEADQFLAAQSRFLYGGATSSPLARQGSRPRLMRRQLSQSITDTLSSSSPSHAPARAQPTAAPPKQKKTAAMAVSLPLAAAAAASPKERPTAQGTAKKAAGKLGLSQSTTKLPAIAKRFQPAQLAASQSEKRLPRAQSRRQSAGSLVNMTQENSPRESASASVASQQQQAAPGLGQTRPINITISAVPALSRDTADLDEFSVLSNITASPLNRSSSRLDG
jgi:hypothetical protein